MGGSTSSLNLCGLVLAGGEGKRLETFVHRLRGDALPKQFVSFVGTRSMLEHTLARAERLIPTSRIFTVIAKNHLRYAEVRRQLSVRKPETVIVQPLNRDTGPGLLLPLVHIARHYPDSTAVVFPSDHFIVKESLFMSHVLQAVRAVMQQPEQVVLLAVKPHRVEPEYGYIIPRVEQGCSFPLGLCRVQRFVEKPDSKLARKLTQSGGLWNTFIMVFKVKTLFGLVRRICPKLHGSFCRIRDAIGTLRERDVMEQEYRVMEPINFSRGFLEVLTLEDQGSLAVFPVPDLGWCDWGSEGRILRMLKELGLQMKLNEFHLGERMTRWEEQKTRGGSLRINAR